MSTLNVSQLKNASAASPAIVLAADGSATAQLSSINGGPLAGTRNRIINGDMRIDQRNNGASVTPVNSQYLVDRWQASLTQASKYTAQQNAGSVTPPAGFRNYLGFTSSSAYSVLSSDIFGFGQVIEGFNVSDFGWGTANAQAVALSFWVRSSLTGAFGGAVKNDGDTRNYPFSFNIAAANTWEYKTVIIPGDTSGTWGSANGAGLNIRFSLGTGSTFSGTAGAWTGTNIWQPTGSTSVVATNGATFFLTGVQLEPGTVATPFERRSYGQELALCQRYFEKSYDITVNPGNNLVGLGGSIEDFSIANQAGPARVRFATSKRTSPSLTVYDAAGNASWVSTFNPNQNNVQPPTAVDNSGTSGFKVFMAQTGLVRVAFHWTATAEL